MIQRILASQVRSFKRVGVPMSRNSKFVKVGAIALIPLLSAFGAAAAEKKSEAKPINLPSTTPGGPGLYRFAREIPIGGEGGWDILTIDSTASRLYLSHATKVVVVDLKKNAVSGEIGDTPGVHAFVPIPELQRGFSSNGKESKSSVVDLTTLKTISKIDTGTNPDDVVYEPRHGEEIG